jgi:hypothetical protein
MKSKMWSSGSKNLPSLIHCLRAAAKQVDRRRAWLSAGPCNPAPSFIRGFPSPPSRGAYWIVFLATGSSRSPWPLVGGLLGAVAAHAAATAMAPRVRGRHAQLCSPGACSGPAWRSCFISAAVFVAGFGFGATLGILLLANFHPMVALLSGLVLGVCGGFLAVKAATGAHHAFHGAAGGVPRRRRAGLFHPLDRLAVIISDSRTSCPR